MGLPTDAFTSYDAVGNREDLIDVITNIAPVDTFFTSHSGSTKALARTHEWQTDTLATAAQNIVIEGDDAANTAIVPTVRKNNTTQILRKVFQVTDTQEAVDKAGRDSEIGYQKAKNLKELARDIEYALVINTAAITGATGTARKMNGLDGFLVTNVTTGTGTANEALTEAMLNDNLQLVWAQGGRPSTILCGAFQKRTISNFSVNTRHIQADSATLARAVDVYESDFGTLRVYLHQQINTTVPTKLFVLGDMEHFKKAWLRPVKSEELARIGAARKFMIEAELTLEVRQEKGHGKVTELATS